MSKKTKLLSKALAGLLMFTIFTTTSATVMANEASPAQTGEMTKVASFREDIDDNTYVIKELFLNSSSKARGFAGTKYATVTHNIYSGNTLEIRVSGNATFNSQLGEDVIYAGGTYTTYDKPDSQSNYWDLLSHSDYSESDVKPLIGKRYAKYSIDYSYVDGRTEHNNTAWVKCDVNGSISNNSRSALLPNQVVIGDDIISFG